MQRGFKFLPQVGKTYEEMVCAQIENKVLKIPEGLTDEEYIEQQKKMRASVIYKDEFSLEAFSFERIVGENTYLMSLTRLKDGSLYQAFTDVTELKKRERATAVNGCSRL